jgi:hypothetical protein
MRRKRKEEEKRKEARRRRLQKPGKVNVGLAASKTSRPLPPEAKPVQDLPPTSRPEKVEETGIGEGYIRPKRQKKEKKPKRVIEKKEEDKIPSFMAGSEEKIPDFGVSEPSREPEPDLEKEKPIFERPKSDNMPPQPPREDRIPEPVWDEDEEEPEEEDLHHDEDRDYGFSHDDVVWSEEGPSSIGEMEDDDEFAEEGEEDLEEIEELEDIEEFEDMEESEQEDETREAIFDEDDDGDELEEWG